MAKLFFRFDISALNSVFANIRFYIWLEFCFCRTELNPAPELCGWKPRQSTDLGRRCHPPCHHLLQGRPPRLHLREDVLCVSVYRCRTRALDSLFKNQTVINDVNITGEKWQKPTSSKILPIPDILPVLFIGSEQRSQFQEVGSLLTYFLLKSVTFKMRVVPILM